MNASIFPLALKTLDFCHFHIYRCKPVRHLKFCSDFIFCSPFFTPDLLVTLLIPSKISSIRTLATRIMVLTIIINASYYIITLLHGKVTSEHRWNRFPFRDTLWSVKSLLISWRSFSFFLALPCQEFMTVAGVKAVAEKCHLTFNKFSSDVSDIFLSD